MKRAVLILSMVAMIPSAVWAHPGRTDSYGCHTCRTNCTKWGLDYGEYHCHRAKALPQPLEPIKSHKSTTSTNGYTTPAPEYKIPAPPKEGQLQKVEQNPANQTKKSVKQPSSHSLTPAEGSGPKESSFWMRLFKMLFVKV